MRFLKTESGCLLLNRANVFHSVNSTQWQFHTTTQSVIIPVFWYAVICGRIFIEICFLEWQRRHKAQDHKTVPTGGSYAVPTTIGRLDETALNAHVIGAIHSRGVTMQIDIVSFPETRLAAVWHLCGT